VLDGQAADAIWQATPGADPVAVPGDRWPAQVNMELVNLSDGIYLVQGVRTGFQHLVIETDKGLVVADAPAGWVELHQIPPEDLVPGLGISGLSEMLIDFLAEEFPDKQIRAVALTHHHDDHAGGARAFAAAGADIWAPAAVTDFLAAALNRETMPPDRLSETAGIARVAPVADDVTLPDSRRPVRLINMGLSPHSIESLGVLAGGYFFQSDLHVPNSDSDEPRSDRIKTECWFAEWAVANLPADTVVINTHSRFRTPVSRLARYLESDGCLRAAFEPQLAPRLVDDDGSRIGEIQAPVIRSHR
jgi:glyoxylase-like metal-dependent hydrolase (beta-lactamase superfamily II)